MQTIVYQCDTAMPAQKLPNCCNKTDYRNFPQSKLPIISGTIYETNRPKIWPKQMGICLTTQRSRLYQQTKIRQPRNNNHRQGRAQKVPEQDGKG